MKKSLLHLTVVLAMAALVATAALAQSNAPLLLRKPTMNKAQIVFAYAGDLWIVPRAGGEATRLTTGVGTETDPLFSPDGQWIAFTGEYDGNADVYLVPATGGVPKRLTYHPAPDRLTAWTPDGKSVQFVSGRSSASRRYDKLFTMPITGALETEIPLPMAFEGSYSADGARLAYVPIQRAFNTWKRYRGGMTTPIWIASLSDSSVEKLPRENSNDFNPMWVGDKVYFLSDRNGPATLFAFDTKTKKVAELIKNDGLDIKSASATGDAIVYEQFGALKIYDLKSGRSTPVNVTLNADLPSVRARYERVGPRLSGGSLSPTGVRAVFEARGEIITVPAEKGDPRNLTHTAGVADRDPSWSPDGKWIAYFSDESGEYALHLREQNGMGEVKKIALEPSFYYSPTWSPDSKKIAFTDKRLNLWYVDVAAGKPIKVDASGAGRQLDPAWSPDSKWIAYAKMLPSWTHAVFVHSVEQGKNTQVTDGLSDALFAQFDKNGKYLYFTASTDIGPTNGGLDMSSYPLRSTRSVYVIVLKKTDSSPLAPESDEEKIAEEKKDGATGGAGDAAKPADTAKVAEAMKPGAKKEPTPVVIDFDNIGQRVLALPIPARNFAGLIAGKTGTLFLFELPQQQGAPGGIIHKFDLEKRKLDKALEGVTAFDVSANGEKML